MPGQGDIRACRDFVVVLTDDSILYQEHTHFYYTKKPREETGRGLSRLDSGVAKVCGKFPILTFWSA